MFSADVERFLVIDRFYQVARTNEDDMVVQLPLVLFVAAHLGHLFEPIEHSLHNLVVSSIHELSNLQGI